MQVYLCKYTYILISINILISLGIIISISILVSILASILMAGNEDEGS